jgi:AcrR family transcriptional regulator
MARPAAANPEETRQRIIAAAVPLFAAHGYAGTSTRILAVGARVNVNTLNHYFGGKQGVYDAAVDEVYRRLHARTQNALIGASLDNLEDLVARAYDAARKEHAGIRILVRQVLDAGRLTRHTEEKHFLPGLKAAADVAVMTLGCDLAQARAAVVTLGYLISRYVIQDDASLQAAFGVRSAARAHDAVVATLVTTAKALLGVAR